MAVEAETGARERPRRPKVKFDPIQQLRAHEYVAEQIRRHIALRLIQPGESLPSERELAQMFGVGRPTIQHALRLLEADHLVEARRGRGGGTFVSEPTEDSLAMDELITRLRRRREEIEERLVYRRIVEPAVARLAAATRRKADVTAMRRAIEAMAEAEEEPEYMRHDTEFHLAVARGTRNRFAVKAIEQIRMELNDAMSLLPESDLWHRRLSGEHEAVADAIEARDEQAAYEAMDVHVANSEQGVRAVLAAIGRQARKLTSR
ncbi:MAG: FadR family transcriptional regulator [Thermoleophilaceae bacterium]|nr:FadR family transcriptional regulator [Thermoleophilaceae bacterium]